jgi:hypothetical protein
LLFNTLSSLEVVAEVLLVAVVEVLADIEQM